MHMHLEVWPSADVMCECATWPAMANEPLMDTDLTNADLRHGVCKELNAEHSKGCWLCAQMLFARTAEDRAKIDLKLHFMRKTLNEVVRALLSVHKIASGKCVSHAVWGLCCIVRQVNL